MDDVESRAPPDTGSNLAQLKTAVVRGCRVALKRVKRCYLDVKNSKRAQRRLIGRLQLVHLLIVSAFLLLFIYTLFSMSDTHKTAVAIVHESINLRFVSVEEARSNIHIRSKDVNCDEIEGRKPLSGYNSLYLPAVMDAAVRLMQQKAMICNCAPLYNVSYRYISSIGQDGELLHLFNPIVTGSPVQHYGRTMVTESQEMLIPGAGSRQVIRMNALTLQYTDEYCITKHDVQFTNRSAWCIQSCIDLLNGKTIYD